MNSKKWKNISIIFSIILGTILHFTFNFLGQNPIVGIFSAVNESTWEHLKLAFFPMLLIAIIGYFIFGKNIKNYIASKSIGIILAISFITIFFYTYSGILGTNYSIINILSFILAIIIGETISYNLIRSQTTLNNTFYLSLILILLICFIIFTFYPPRIALFQDPINKTYGIFKLT